MFVVAWRSPRGANRFRYFTRRCDAVGFAGKVAGWNRRSGLAVYRSPVTWSLLDAAPPPPPRPREVDVLTLRALLLVRVAITGGEVDAVPLARDVAADLGIDPARVLAEVEDLIGSGALAARRLTLEVPEGRRRRTLVRLPDTEGGDRD